MFDIAIFFALMAIFFYGYAVGFKDETVSQYIDSAILAVLSTLSTYAAIGTVLKIVEHL